MEYLHHSPVPGGYKYRDMALQQEVVTSSVRLEPERERDSTDNAQ
jgi:hypothetical protein